MGKPLGERTFQRVPHVFLTGCERHRVMQSEDTAPECV